MSVALVAVGLASACVDQLSVVADPPVPLGQVLYPPDSAISACSHTDTTTGGGRMRELMDSLRWAPGCIPMFTDDQRLNNGDGGYGPVAHVAPAPDDTINVISKFNVPLNQAVLVGIVLVDTTDGAILPRSYQELFLSPGFSCVYLRHEAGQPDANGWHAYITKLTAIRSTGFCTAPTVEQGFHVIADRDPAFLDPSDYPPVGRFRESNSPARPNAPLIGFKCAAAFCLIGPRAATGQFYASEHRGVRPTLRNWQAFGWNDEQHVAMDAAGAPGAKPQWNFNASIVAAPGLGGRKIKEDFDTGLVHVATVYLKRNPPKGSKYDVKWHFEKGDNFILLRHDVAAGRDDGWTGFIRHNLTPTPYEKFMKAVFGIPYEWLLKVSRTDHSGIHVPGTARFKWAPNDEDDWARCDHGCCQVGVF